MTTSRRAALAHVVLTPTQEVMYKNKKEVDAEREIRDAFKVFDKDGKGTVATSELRAVLTSMGEKLTEEEVPCDLVGT